jgi:hypothetical protein
MIAPANGLFADTTLRPRMGIGYYSDGIFTVVSVAYWLLTLATFVIGAAPWIKWRFSLLSIFVAMTLIAGLLALAMSRDWVNTEPQNTIPPIPPEQLPTDVPRFTPVGYLAWSCWSSMPTHRCENSRTHFGGTKQITLHQCGGNSAALSAC